MKKLLLIGLSSMLWTGAIYAEANAAVLAGNKVAAVAAKKSVSLLSPINVNKADLADLMRIPGVGPTRAQLIIAFRQEHGAFQSLDELAKVKGISASFVKKNSEYISLG